MAKISPFKGFRAPRNMVHLVASRSYISYSSAGLKHKLTTNPYSFINIINPEFGEKKKTKANTGKRFQHVKEKFDEFIAKKIFIQDEQECFYLYRQNFLGHEYTGIIAGTSIDDYQNGVIKKHEHTIIKRELIFKNYLELTDFNAEPVVMTYPDDKPIAKLYEKYTQTRPEYDFMSANSATHEFWVINNKKDIELIIKEFEGFDSLYIADGHHRSASSNLLGQELRIRNPHHTGKEKYNFLMTYLIPESQLHIMEFNRLITDLNGLTDDEFLAEVSDYFIVHPLEVKTFKPKSYNQIGMYMEGKWYALDAKVGMFDENHPVERLDVSILTNNLLDPILGIKDLRSDPRVQFAGGMQSVEDLVKLVDRKKFKAAFILSPVTIDQLKAVADNHQYMPPKSTWVEPKIRSGLVLYKISE